MMEKRGVASGELEPTESARPPEKLAAHGPRAKGGHPPCGEDPLSRVAETAAAAGSSAKAGEPPEPSPD